MIIKSLKQFKKIFVGIIGSTIVIIGLAMIVLPGPAFIVIPLGLSILATEFLWARKIVDRLKDKFNQMANKKRNNK